MGSQEVALVSRSETYQNSSDCCTPCDDLAIVPRSSPYLPMLFVFPEGLFGSEGYAPQTCQF